jgi:GTP diphosphokinase / guanosine-3',5'-bis(diphosphate) 3'-diphosphatase
MPDQVVRDPEVPLAPARAGAAGGRRTVRRAADEGDTDIESGPITATGPVAITLDLEALRQHLLVTVGKHHPQAELSMVNRAFDLAVEAHSSQVRASGDPYVTHPIASAQILAELGIDPVAVSAALLHDVAEDTEYSLADVEERFGPEVAHMVDGVTKLSKFSTHSHEQQQAENIRKMFLAMADDIRVVLIKLADRLHNMRTLGALKTEKQQRIARQTLEIYAPLAERLGIWQIKWELEDLSFKALEPEAFRELARLLDTRRTGRETYIERAIAELRPRLADAGIEAELQGRPKHIYSIWKKMERKGAEFGEIYDVYAIRLLVDDIRDCYAALGIVHALWRPIPGQFDDYIAVPKNNLYQSLHTAVIALDGKPLEIQIRTHAMHQVSEVGIAAHWRYKEGSKAERDYDAKLAWLRQLMEWQRDVSESDATEFVEGIKLDIFQDQVFVFTPRGDVKDLPAGATPLDFAYRIHTDIGHRTIGAKVNNRLVPLDYRLNNGDIVEIVTTKGEHGPSRDWMNIVRTSHAREKIRQWFKKKDRAENIVHGRESLERELRRLARTSLQAIGHEKLAEVATSYYKHETVDDFLAAIGYGAISAQQVVMRLGVLDDGQITLPTVAPPQPARTGGVRVKGVGDLLVRFAKCCHPIPGDPIAGFITRGKGITVHLRSCPTIQNEREVSRLIEVEWDAAPAQTYPIAIRVEAYDRTGLLSDITQIMAENKVNILAANLGVSPDHTAFVSMTLQVASVAQLAKVMSRVEQLKDVLSVQRDLS